MKLFKIKIILFTRTVKKIKITENNINLYGKTTKIDK